MTLLYKLGNGLGYETRKTLSTFKIQCILMDATSGVVKQRYYHIKK